MAKSVLKNAVTMASTTVSGSGNMALARSQSRLVVKSIRKTSANAADRPYNKSRSQIPKTAKPNGPDKIAMKASGHRKVSTIGQ